MSYIVGEAYETFVHKINANGDIMSAELLYIVSFDQDASELDALNAIREVAPGTVGVASVQSFEIDEMFDLAHYKVSVEYGNESSSSSGSSDTDEEEEPTVSFNCGGGTRHVTTAIKQTMARKSNAPAVDIGNGINWNGQYGDNSEFAGVDVPSADLQETYTKVMKISSLTTAFRRKVAGLVGCVNVNTFKGWEPGEVMFLGCSFSGVDRARERVSVSFNFSIKPNEKNVKLEDIPLGNVAGWDYVWTLKPKTTWSNNSVKTELQYAFVAQVAPRKNFSALGL